MREPEALATGLAGCTSCISVRHGREQVSCKDRGVEKESEADDPTSLSVCQVALRPLTLASLDKCMALPGPGIAPSPFNLRAQAALRESRAEARVWAARPPTVDSSILRTIEDGELNSDTFDPAQVAMPMPPSQRRGA